MSPNLWPGSSRSGRVRGSFVARHAAGLVLAGLLAALLVAPRWWLLLTDPAHGVRVPVSVWGAGTMGTDEALEASTIRQAYDGKLPVRSPYLENHRDGPLQAGAAWQEAIGILGHVTGGPFWSLAVVTTIMAAWAVLALYALAFRLTASRLAAACLLPIAMAAVQVFNNANGAFSLRYWGVLEPILTIHTAREFLVWSRFLSPIMVLGSFFSLAVALPRAVDTGDRRWMAGSAVLLALLVYSYVFYWTAMALAVAGWGAWLLLRGDVTAFKRLALIGTAALLLALPELVILVNRSLTASGDVQARIGQEPLSVHPREMAQRLILALPFIAVLLRGPSRNGLFVALALSPLVLCTVDGIVPQEWRFRTQVWGVFCIPAVIAGAVELRRFVPRRLTPALVSLSCFAALIATAYLVAFQARAIVQTDASFSMSADDGAGFAWIRSNVRGDETVVSSSVNTNLLLAALTPASEYNMDGFNPVASDEELIDRFLRTQVAYGYGASSTFVRLDPDNGTYDELSKLPEDELERRAEEMARDFLFFDEKYEEIEERIPSWWIRFLSLQLQSNVLAEYPADYVYCGPGALYWPAEHAPSGIYVTVAFHTGSVTIYQLANAGDSGAERFAGCSPSG